MKVLQINAVYGHGSTGTIVMDLERICDRNDIECYVASPDRNVLKAKRHYLIGNNIDHKIHALMTRLTGMQGYYSKRATKKLVSYIKDIKPDIVHLHNLHSNYINLNILFGYLAKQDIATVVTLHDCWFYTGGCFHYTAAGCNKWQANCGKCPKKGQDNFSLFFDTSAKILSDRKKLLLKIPRLYIVGVSNWIAEEASKGFLTHSNVSYIRNGIDLEVFKPTISDIRQRLNLDDKYLILGPASKWLMDDNRPVLEYFSKNMRDDEVLLLYGATNKNIDLPDNVILYGYTKDRKELAALYNCADVFANVTREDSLSLINVEAQACGTPVVTFDATGPKETVDGLISKSVPVGKSDLLLNGVHEVRDRDIQNTVEVCRDFIKENFDMPSQYNRFIELYKKII